MSSSKHRPSHDSLDIKRILIVDNDSEMRDYLAKVIGELGYHAITSKDGADAMEFIASSDPFHAIVTEVHMPRIDGVELAKVIRHSESKIPIIFMSADLGKIGQYSRSQLTPLSPHYERKPIIAEDFKKRLKVIVEELVPARSK